MKKSDEKKEREQQKQNEKCFTFSPAKRDNEIVHHWSEERVIARVLHLFICQRTAEMVKRQLDFNQIYRFALSFVQMNHQINQLTKGTE